MHNVVFSVISSAKATMKAEKTTERRAETAAQKAAQTEGKMGLENAENIVNTATDDILQRLWQSFKRSRKCQCKTPSLEFKKFDEDFYFKSLKKMSTEKYRAFVDRLQKRYELTDKTKDSLLDSLDCAENEEKVQSFKFNDGEGKIYHGRFVTVKKDDKMDVAYAVYVMSFELSEIETKDWVYKWWLYVIPIGWKYKNAALVLTEEQKNRFSKWCEWKLHLSVEQECSKDEMLDC